MTLTPAERRANVNTMRRLAQQYRTAPVTIMGYYDVRSAQTPNGETVHIPRYRLDHDTRTAILFSLRSAANRLREGKA